MNIIEFNVTKLWTCVAVNVINGRRKEAVTMVNLRVEGEYHIRVPVYTFQLVVDVCIYRPSTEV